MMLLYFFKIMNIDINEIYFMTFLIINFLWKTFIKLRSIFDPLKIIYCYSVLKIFAIFFIDSIYCYFFAFYSIYIWSTTILIFFNDIYNTIYEHNQRQTHYLSLVLNYFDIYFSVNYKFLFITSTASSLIIMSILSMYEWIIPSSSLFVGEIKLFAIANWNFHLPYFLRLSMMSFKYGLILLISFNW